MFRAFIQARMSSSRFPGKVLAPFCGVPLLAHVVERVARVVPRTRITVATSTEGSDDPLAEYARLLGVQVYRGVLDDVFRRFRGCLRESPCDWFYRVCADSPLLLPGLLTELARHADPATADIVTNVFPRTFPQGQSAELIRAEAFLSVDPASLSNEEREHVTLHFYNRPRMYRIVNIVNPHDVSTPQSLAVDTLSDMRRLERDVANLGRLE
ncbi:cytidylyltransferase domain-containing protein [Desulfobaculum senezii]